MLLLLFVGSFTLNLAYSAIPIIRRSEAISRPHESIVRLSESIVRPSDSIVRPRDSIARPHESIARPHESIARLSESIAKSCETDLAMRRERLCAKPDHENITSVSIRLRTSFPQRCSTMAKPNSRAVPAPREVITFFVTTTFSLSSASGNSAMVLACAV